LIESQEIAVWAFGQNKNPELLARLISASTARFRFPTSCSVSKLKRFKGDFGQKSRPNFVPFDRPGNY